MSIQIVQALPSIATTVLHGQWRRVVWPVLSVAFAIAVDLMLPRAYEQKIVEHPQRISFTTRRKS